MAFDEQAMIEQLDAEIDRLQKIRNSLAGSNTPAGTDKRKSSGGNRKSMKERWDIAKALGVAGRPANKVEMARYEKQNRK